MPSSIKAIIGLANPGAEYADTRHNAGAWFIEALCHRNNQPLRAEKKFLGEYAKLHIEGEDIHLLIPATFMNRSGQAVAALARFYKLAPEEILVAHDELDIAPGEARFKKSGGHGGHNGLRDIISALGNNRDFYRLRVGIGHPGEASKVVNYVLGAPSKPDRIAIDNAVDAAIGDLPLALKGEWNKAMNHLHGLHF